MAKDDDATLLVKRTTSVEKAGRILGISRNSAYEAARRGQLPCSNGC